MKTSTRAATVAIPDSIFCAADFADAARDRLPADVWAWLEGGSGDDRTAQANVDALRRWRLVPRPLAPITPAGLGLRLAGHLLPHPILLAPVAAQALLAAEAEVETARGAAVAGACMILSAMSSRDPAHVAAVPGARLWYQLPFGPTRPDTLAALERAAALGFEAVVVTIDAALQWPSRQALRAGFRMPRHAQRDAPAPAPMPRSVFERRAQAAVTRQDLAWLAEVSRLPLIVKGVLHPEDARTLQALGVEAIVVSNHGGRSVDGVCASLDALPAVRAAVGEDLRVLFDGGIRSGADVFTALARGADAVLVGRAQAQALAVAGALGVAHLVRLLREELELYMAMAGCGDLAAIRRATLLPGREDGPR